MKKYSVLKLVQEEKYGKIGVLGEPTEVDRLWLDMQEIKYDDDAEFFSMYPLDGGAMVVDRNKIKHLGAPTDEQMKEILCEETGFNPAGEAIKELAEEINKGNFSY